MDYLCIFTVKRSMAVASDGRYINKMYLLPDKSVLYVVPKITNRWYCYCINTHTLSVSFQLKKGDWGCVCGVCVGMASAL